MPANHSSSLWVLAAAVLLVAAVASSLPIPDTGNWEQVLPQWLASQEVQRPWEQLHASHALRGQDGSVRPWLTEVITRVHAWTQTQLDVLPSWLKNQDKGLSNEMRQDLPDHFWRFVPPYVASVNVEGLAPSWEAPCFKQTSATVQSDDENGNSYTIVIEASEPSSLTCSDVYLVGTVEGVHLRTVLTRGKHTIKWNMDKATPNEKEWVQRNGFRIFRFLDGVPTTLVDVLSTVEMFLPEAAKNGHISDTVAKQSLKFLKDYVGVDMKPRHIQNVDVPKESIKSGDFMGIIRLDGLETMQVWGTGAHTGHTVLLMWEDDELYVMESTDKTAYWPIPNIQKNKYDDWIKMAREAQYSTVLLPLTDEMREKFDAAKALEFYKQVEGKPYGYHNFIWGWVDTPEDNWPGPLSLELVEVAFSLVDKLSPAIATRMWGEAFNKRLGTNESSTIDILAQAWRQGVSFGQLVSMPEQDDWVYSDGPSMVCDVFVCEMYKAGGLFGDLRDQIQCTEFQNWDVETLAFFNTTAQRPQQCVEADPDLPFCQLTGAYQLTLPGFGTVQPYAHMREHCPALPPLFKRPEGC